MEKLESSVPKMSYHGKRETCDLDALTAVEVTRRVHRRRAQNAGPEASASSGLRLRASRGTKSKTEMFSGKNVRT